MLIEPCLKLRQLIRATSYRLLPAGALRYLKRESSEHETAAYWNEELSGRMSAPNRNGRMSNALRDHTAGLLIAECGPVPRRVLDMGCGFGELAPVLVGYGMEHYHGVDLSDYVIDRARAESPTWPIAESCTLKFDVADLRSFVPPTGATYDAIVLNEVLKYVSIHEAVTEVDRLGRYLSPGGVICVNISGDAKSQAVFRALESHCEWVYGTVYQQRPDGAHYRLTRNTATPPFLVGIFRPRTLAGVAA